MSDSDETYAYVANYRHYKSLGTKMYLQRKYDKAISYFGTALKISPNNRDCLVGRSKCYLKEGRPDKALKDAELALQIDEEFSDAMLMRAEAYYQQGNFEAALIYFHRGSNYRGKEMFVRGVFKCEEAILNGVQWLDNAKQFSYKNTEVRTESKEDSKQTTSVFMYKNDSTVPSESKMWILLEELYRDKRFLNNVVKTLDCRRETSWLSKLVIINHIVYFNNQSKLLFYKMPVINETKPIACFKLTDHLRDMNQSFNTQHFRECIDKCLYILNTYSLMDQPDKKKHVAEIYSVLGACYLEKYMLNEARAIYIYLLDIGNKLDDNDIILNAVSGIVKTFSDDREYKLFAAVGDINRGVIELQEMWLRYRLGICYIGVNNEFAERYLRMCVEIAEENMNNSYIAKSLTALACLQIKKNHIHEALELMEECLRIVQDTNEYKEDVESVTRHITLLLDERRMRTNQMKRMESLGKVGEENHIRV
ncbi:tetratricopeptide repeat protein 25-like isoform X1 [Argonauta hians]